MLDSRTLSNGTSPRDTTCDSRHERAGVDTYLGYRGPPRGRAGLRECLVSLGTSLMVIPKRQRAPELMLPSSLGSRIDEESRQASNRSDTR
jgi:hypothetical protein